MNEPSPLSPLVIECPTCGGSGCESCGDRGSFELAECPVAFAGSETWELIGLVDLYRRGLPPVAGGSLDQTAWFNAAARRVWGEHQRLERDNLEAAR